MWDDILDAEKEKVISRLGVEKKGEKGKLSWGTKCNSLVKFRIIGYYRFIEYDRMIKCYGGC